MDRIWIFNAWHFQLGAVSRDLLFSWAWTSFWNKSSASPISDKYLETWLIPSCPKATLTFQRSQHVSFRVCLLKDHYSVVYRHQHSAFASIHALTSNLKLFSSFPSEVTLLKQTEFADCHVDLAEKLVRQNLLHLWEQSKTAAVMPQT